MESAIPDTDRLTFKKITPEIYDALFKNSSNEEIKAFFGFETDAALEAEKAKYAVGIRTFNKTFLYFQLLDKNTQSIIGWCGYHTWYLDHARAEIGYGLFGEEHKNKGLMTEAMRPILDYGFDQMKLNRVEAFVGLNNVPSLRLLKRFNFTQEGHVREHYNNTGTPEDSLIFSLLLSERDQ